MRIAWVHPSWRDLVIDHLSSEHEARERFLRNCSVHGALLALSLGGGHRGERELPLLQRDADWDALTDRLYTLVPELEPAELLGLMDGLELTIHDLTGTPAAHEADALATAVLARLTTVWRTARAPIPLPALEAWFTLAGGLSSKPEPPATSVTWTELIPTAAPQLTDGANLERFADWLTLAELLMDYDPGLLAGLGFRGHTERFCAQFLEALERDRRGVAPADIARAVRALNRIPRVFPALAGHADSVRFRLTRDEYLSSTSSLSEPLSQPAPQAGNLDVQRVLADL
jgi:hypothetical protein